MATWTNTTKNNSSFSAYNKSDVISTMAGRVGYGAVGRSKVGSTTDNYGVLTSWSNQTKN